MHCYLLLSSLSLSPSLFSFSFVLVTVRAATEYIKSSDVDKYLSHTRHRRTSGVSDIITIKG